MRALRTLNKRDYLLLFQAVWCLSVAVITVKLSSFSVLKQRIQSEPACKPQTPAAPSPKRVLWAIEAISRRLPGLTCLIKSIAAQSLLARYGYSATVQIGAAMTNGALEAHSWLEHEGRVVLGGSASQERYTVFNLSQDQRTDTNRNTNQ